MRRRADFRVRRFLRRLHPPSSFRLRQSRYLRLANQPHRQQLRVVRIPRRQRRNRGHVQVVHHVCERSLRRPLPRFSLKVRSHRRPTPPLQRSDLSSNVVGPQSQGMIRFRHSRPSPRTNAHFQAASYPKNEMRSSSKRWLSVDARRTREDERETSSVAIRRVSSFLASKQPFANCLLSHLYTRPVPIGCQRAGGFGS